MTERWGRKGARLVTAAVLATPLVALASGPVRAAVPLGEQLYKSNDCVTCHAVNQKLVGPSYVDIAKKFAGQKDAVATLVKAVKDGHVGTWGMVPMPPHPTLSDADIKAIVEWILSLK
ncbi:MAG: c-type cytochrome [Rhodospirillales bacterium]|nr:c-type cytochrome [Rhodospirillales bacterium]